MTVKTDYRPKRRLTYLKRPLKSFVAIALSFLLAESATTAVIHVPGDLFTIQAALDSASTGDTVLVAPGTYQGNGNRDIDFAGKAVVLLSEEGPDSTIIDCRDIIPVYGSFIGFYFHSGEDSTSVVDGFTITNSDREYWGELNGGAVYCKNSSPTIRNCFISSQWSKGAIYCDQASPIIDNCLFRNNQSGCFTCKPKASETDGNSYAGGAALRCENNSSPVVIDCFFEDNSSDITRGGAIACYSSDLTVLNTTFIHNSADFGWGGAVYIGDGSAVFMSECYFISNLSRAGPGGAIAVSNSSLTVDFCLFDKNQALDHFWHDGEGGAIFADDQSTVSVVNSTLTRNRAKGPYHGAAIKADGGSTVDIDKSIVAFNRTKGALSTSGSGTEFTLSCANLFGNYEGDWIGSLEAQADLFMNMSVDPRFCDTSSTNFHLFNISPCLDSNNSCESLIGAFGKKCTWVCVDSDGDGFGDPSSPGNTCPADNCPDIFNPDQNDNDRDSIGNSCDNCPDDYNSSQADADSDGVGDACDQCPEFDDSLDDDLDGVPDLCDICPGFDDKLDSDGDGIPDGCDVCIYGDNSIDSDNDSIADACDNCPSIANQSQEDADGDGFGDVCDLCPGFDDSLNTDGDLLPDSCDNCPDFINDLQEDIDSDGVGDSCDNCMNKQNPEQLDADSNGVGDLCCCVGLRGNINGDPLDEVNITDITFVVRYLFGDPTGPPPGCPYEGNANGDPDEMVNIADLTFLIDYLFGLDRGDPPPACPE